MEKVKFVSITRTIDPKTRIHYLDAIDEDGRHWMAEMSHKVEQWQVFTEEWRLGPQQPCEESQSETIRRALALYTEAMSDVDNKVLIVNDKKRTKKTIIL